VKPDSHKTTTEQMADHVKGSADSAASALQPQSEKSTSQQIGDSASSGTNESMLDKAKNAVGMGQK